MKLRIVAGSLRGRTLNFPDSKVAFRPTLERTRQALADMLQRNIGGGRVADLCAGSGAFGFEMLSRGAATADFVENDRNRAASIQRHAEKFGVLDRCRIMVRDVTSFAAVAHGAYAVIFFDPPYDREEMAPLVPVLTRMLSPGGMLLYQRRRRKTRESDGAAAALAAPDEIKTFGDTIVECYRCRESGD
jgi:16S rRNA (guanine966-N2)-methyltransferase